MNCNNFIVAHGEVSRVFQDRDVSIAEWARVNGFSAALVYQVLEGRSRKRCRGQSFRIAEALGLQEATPLEVTDVAAVPSAGQNRPLNPNFAVKFGRKNSRDDSAVQHSISSLFYG